MGVCDAPEWLQSEWLRSCLEAGATAPAADIEEAGVRLLHRWCQADRRFHNLRHLVDVLAHVDELAEEAHRPALVRLAAFYHGVVFHCEESSAYAGRGGEDERASADLAESELTALGMSRQNAGRVAALVMTLVDHTPRPRDGDCAVLCDAELATLASEPQRYREYLREVRAEYSHLPLEDFLVARERILQRLLSRPSLFASSGGEQWEEPARQNMTAELHRVAKELAKLRLVPDATGPEPDRGTGPTETLAASTDGGRPEAPGEAARATGASGADGRGAPGPARATQARRAVEPERTPAGL